MTSGWREDTYKLRSLLIDRDQCRMAKRLHVTLSPDLVPGSLMQRNCEEQTWYAT